MKQVIVGHGTFAQGAYGSLEIICGQDISVIDMRDDVGLFESSIASLEDEEMVFYVDSSGGPPFNPVYKHILNQRSKQMVVSGLNLSILSETDVQANFKNIEQLYDELKQNDISSIVIAKNWN